MDTLSNPILNSPYEAPERHFALGPNGPTGEILPGRRPSESFIPVPVSKKKRGKNGGPEQESLELFDTTGERREQNSLINDMRQRVELWRGRGYPHVTPISRKLMQHWADPTREERVLFCQREAAETAIYLAEVAGRRGEPDFRTRIDPENDLHNDGLPRIAVKMATGTGKTIVMCMLIAWQVCNKAYNKRDARFTSRFLVIAPGITIRDRLRVLFPHDDGNYYDFQGLVPNDLRNLLDDAAIVITNYHTFLPKLAKEFGGVSKNTRLILTGGEDDGRFHESDEDVVDRIMRDLSSRGKGEVIVINDEAHHCYQDKPLDSGTGASKLKKDDKERNEHARVWFRGIEAVAERVGVKTVYDLSATPFYLSGSGYHEGFIFPWVVSDFSLMDAIESGVVKVPRIPVDDDVKNTDQPTYLALWQHVGDQLPKKRGRKAKSDSDWVPPPVLEGALRSLYRSYEKRHAQWKEELEALGEPPPVMIVVCPNTIVSKLVYDWIAGQEIELPDGREIIRPGRLPLLSNVDGGDWINRPPTIIVDSAQLESGEALKGDFKDAAAKELEVFKSEYRARNPGADVDQLTDQDILREVLNTVGKRGKLGETIRCVVSVAMLTEGWDANTVTHILGIRAFESQLLCEQVVGRGLRRRSYVPNKEGRFEPEYAEVYGVPFAFIPTDREVQPQKPPRSPVEVFAVADRHDLRIDFPKLDGYRVELPEAPVEFDYENTTPIAVDESLVATWTEAQGIVGEADEAELEIVKHARRQEIAFNVAAEVLTRHFPGHAGALKPWLFPALLRITKQWYDEKLTFAPGNEPGLLLLAEPKAWAAEAIYNAVVQYPDARNKVLLPLYRRFDSEGSTDDVDFLTRKAVVEAMKSPVNLVVLDGPRGNTWEETVAALLEANDDVHSYVKNDHLSFEIPYVHAGKSHQYIPDFLVRLKRQEEEDVARTLIIEVSGGQKSPGPTTAKAQTARNQWCTAVNNDAGWGRWGYVEIDTMVNAEQRIARAITLLYADAPIIGEPVI